MWLYGAHVAQEAIDHLPLRRETGGMNCHIPQYPYAPLRVRLLICRLEYRVYHVYFDGVLCPVFRFAEISKELAETAISKKLAKRIPRTPMYFKAWGCFYKGEN